MDSTVNTALISKALGPNKVTAVHIDNGFLRKNEIEQVIASLVPLGISAQGKESCVIFFTFIKNTFNFLLSLS